MSKAESTLLTEGLAEVAENELARMKRLFPLRIPVSMEWHSLGYGLNDTLAITEQHAEPAPGPVKTSITMNLVAFERAAWMNSGLSLDAVTEIVRHEYAHAVAMLKRWDDATRHRSEWTASTFEAFITHEYGDAHGWDWKEAAEMCGAKPVHWLDMGWVAQWSR